MPSEVPKRNRLFTDVCTSRDAGLISLLLETSDGELKALERLYEATRHIRASGATRERKDEAIERLFDQDPSLRDDLRALTGRGQLIGDAPES